jgi:hypothetical protein
MAIMALKSNFKWTDRNDISTSLTDQQLQALRGRAVELINGEMDE